MPEGFRRLRQQFEQTVGREFSLKAAAGMEAPTISTSGRCPRAGWDFVAKGARRGWEPCTQTSDLRVGGSGPSGRATQKAQGMGVGARAGRLLWLRFLNN